MQNELLTELDRYVLSVEGAFCATAACARFDPVTGELVYGLAGHPPLFVRHPDGDYELHDVVLGKSAGGKVEVVTGLREGEQVVSEGVFTLKSAILKSTFAEDE